MQKIKLQLETIKLKLTLTLESKAWTNKLEQEKLNSKKNNKLKLNFNFKELQEISNSYLNSRERKRFWFTRAYKAIYLYEKWPLPSFQYIKIFKIKIKIFTFPFLPNFQFFTHNPPNIFQEVEGWNFSCDVGRKMAGLVAFACSPRARPKWTSEVIWL